MVKKPLVLSALVIWLAILSCNAPTGQEVQGVALTLTALASTLRAQAGNVPTAASSHTWP